MNRTERARAAAHARFVNVVDPDATLDRTERHRHADVAQRAHLRAAGAHRRPDISGANPAA